MAQIATCPHCVSEVYAPEASGDASVACPVCEKPFVLSAARRRPLPEAKPVAPAPPEEKLSKPPATERTPTASEMMQAFLHPKAASNELAGTLPAPKSKLASPLAPTPKPAFEMELDDLMRSVPEHDEENDQTPGGSSSDEAALAANAPSSEEGNSREPENAPPRDAVPRRTLASMLAESPRLDQQLLKASLPSRQPSSDVSHTRTDPETPAESTALVPSDKEASATPFRLPEFGLPQSNSGIASPLEMDEAPPDELMLDDNSPGVLQGGFDRPVAGYSGSRPRSRKRSAAVFVTGMVVFSLAGLLMGYGVLMRLGGQRSDFLGLLPRLPASVRALIVGEDPTETNAQIVGGASDPNVLPATFESPSDAPPKSLAARVAENQPPTPVEPERFEPEAPQAIQLIGAPSYANAELREAVTVAEGSSSTLTTLSYDASQDRAEIGAAYGRLCKVAQVYTFFDGIVDPADEFAEADAEDLFRKVFASEHARRDSQTVALRWLAWTGRPHGGVFFAAEPKSRSRAGSVYEYAFDLVDPDAPGPVEVTVLMPDRHDDRRFARSEAIAMGVVGCVVERPSEVVPGYKGKAERAVWVGQGNNAMPLGPPPLP